MMRPAHGEALSHWTKSESTRDTSRSQTGEWMTQIELVLLG